MGKKLSQMLSQRSTVSTVDYIHLGDPNSYVCSLEQHMRQHAHHLFYGEGVNRPSRTEQLWHMTQMARWGDTPFPRNWLEILERVCRVRCSAQRRELGLLDIKYHRGPIQLFE